MSAPVRSAASQLPGSGGVLNTLQQAAVFAEKRHDVLVGNVANIDTPTYQTRDLDVKGFQKALAAAIEARRQPQPTGFVPTHPYLNQQATEIDALLDPTIAEPRNITFQDGNNRSIEQEMGELSKNIMKQTFLIEVMSAHFRQLETVITERV